MTDFTAPMSCVADVLCACDAIQPKSSMGVPEDHPALFSPKNAAPKHHAKLHESRILSTGEQTWQLSMLATGDDTHKRS